MIVKKALFVNEQAFGKDFYITKSNKGYKLNETGIFVWELIDGENTVDDIVESIFQRKEYDIELMTLKKDIEELILQFIKLSLVNRIEA